MYYLTICRPIKHLDGFLHHRALFSLDFASPTFGALVVVAGGSVAITIQRHGQRLPLVKHHGGLTLRFSSGTKGSARAASVAGELAHR